MRRILPIAVAAAALCAGQLPATAPAASASAQAAQARAAAPAKERTPFAMAALAYGSRADGGQAPADSDATAYRQIGCTNVAGINRRNHEADLRIPGLGVAEGVTSRVWTTSKGPVVSSSSRHSIAELTIAETPIGKLQLRGLSSTSTAFNRNGAFGARVDTEIARIVFKPTGMPAQELRIPTPGRPVVVPGLARIELGSTGRKVTPDEARASGNVLDVKLLPSGTRVQVAQTRATIGGGVRSGVFKGFSAGVRARGLDGNVRSGRTPLLVMPCQGTDGEREVRDAARVDLGGQVVARGAATRQRSTNRARRASGTERGQVAHVALADGRVQIDGIVGQVRVIRSPGRIARSTKGTTVGRITIDGDVYTLPENEPLEIPGLVRLEDAVTDRTPAGIEVIGLRATLLDGSGAVVDLGVAELAIRRGVGARR